MIKAEVKIICTKNLKKGKCYSCVVQYIDVSDYPPFLTIVVEPDKEIKRV